MSGKSGLTLSYHKTLDVLTAAYASQFTEKHGARRAKELARELAQELLRPALSVKARKELDIKEARRLHARNPRRA